MRCLWMAAALFLCAASCPARRPPDDRIRLEVNPRILTAGSVVRGTLCLREPARRVRLKAEVFGSRSRDVPMEGGKLCYELKRQIPWGTRLKSGVYRLRATVDFEDGSRGFQWATVELQ